MAARRRTVAEEAWWLEVNGERILGGTATPADFEALAVGRLIADGFIGSARELLAIETLGPATSPVRVLVRIPDNCLQQALAERRHRHEHGCGLWHFVRCDPGALRRARQAALGAHVPLDLMPELFRELFGAGDPERASGGTHVAALCEGTHIVEWVEEVGRHNAVDKVLGRALLADRAASDLGLLLSARISGEIALKAARAGCAWLASRSIPTDLAVEIATAAGLPMMGRAASPEPVFFNPSETARSSDA